MTDPRPSWAAVALGVLAIASVVVLGAALRLEDPASTSVVPAEDPYTHMTFIREHLRNGVLGPLYEGGDVYPPGMHAFLATFWVFTGLELYEIIRFMPVVFGAIGIMGVGLLLWRHLGAAAGFVGALAYALAPEVIFRTTMMSPTALDLAILPFFLFALLETGRGRLGWVGVAGPMAIFLVAMHPWVFWILGLTGVLFLLLRLAVPWRPAHAHWTPLGFASVAAIIGAGVAGAALMGAGDVFDAAILQMVPRLAPFLLLLSLVPLFLAWQRPQLIERILSWRQDRPASLRMRLAGSAVLVLLFALVTVPALQSGLPQYVDLPAMIGWPILLLGGFAFAALPFVARPIAHLGAALSLATYPFALHNVFSSEFWPHRTVAFLALGLVLLVGMTTWMAEAAVRRLGVGLQETTARPGVLKRLGLSEGSGRLPRSVSGAASVMVPVLLVAGTLGGGVVAVAPEPYDGWYRLFHECEQEALAEVAALADAEPDAVVVTGSWQAKLVVGALATNVSRIWYSPAFYTDEREQQDLPAWLTQEGRSLYVVVDKHTRSAVGPEALAVYDTGAWHQVAGGCATSEAGVQALTAHVFVPEAAEA